MIDGECQTFTADCQVRVAAELIRHAWDPVVLAALRAGPTRRADLMRSAQASDKVLSEALRRLRDRGLVTKATGHAGAVYELTPLGVSFAEGPLAHLGEWAVANHDALTSAL